MLSFSGDQFGHKERVLVNKTWTFLVVSKQNNSAKRLPTAPTFQMISCIFKTIP